MYKKILLSLAATLIFFSGISSSLTFASEVEDNEQNYTQEEVEALAKELQFYFEEVGHVDDNGNYHIDNYELLKEKAESGDVTAQGLVEQINYENQVKENQGYVTTYSLYDYAGCILANFFGTEIALINGDLINNVMGQIEKGAWMKVSEIVLRSIGGSVGKANIVATASQLIVYTAYCGGQQV
ncbi:MAG: hypothetical protein L0I88_05295 [Alkalibacterium sp.]|nr:hypothetical protein [Alkalibacterium sp.]